MKKANPVLIIVNGLPATGKSHLATRLASDLNLPIFRKDDFKELLADNANRYGLKSSLEFGLFSRKILNHIITQLTKEKLSLIVDSNFSPGIETSELKKIIKKNRIRVIEILCKTEGKVLVERFIKRAKTQRHKIHLEHYLDFSKFEKTLSKGRIKPVMSSKNVIEIDTTDFAKIPYRQLVRQTESFMNFP